MERAMIPTAFPASISTSAATSTCCAKRSAPLPRARLPRAPRRSIVRTNFPASCAILYPAERATWTALETIQCLGGNGYINDYPAGRLLRDAKLYEIGAGTSEIRRMLIGREIFEKTR
jgi:alkylation response protein AidB-like acyl-CoA dehydrogenase